MGENQNPGWIAGSCKCGAVKMWQRRAGGLFAFRCHCSHCRNAYEKDEITQGKYSSGNIDWCCNIKSEGPVKSTFTCSPSTVCLRREECAECGTPTVSRGRGSLTGFTFINFENFNRGQPVPLVNPDANIFYNSGLKEGEDGIKTYYSDVGSLCCFIGQLTKNIVTCKACCCSP